jgi:chromosome segregation ATPase
MNMNDEKINDLAEQIQTTETLLEVLQLERSDFPNLMTSAVSAGDPAAMINLRRRQDEIPVAISTAQIRLARLQLEADQERLPVLQAEVAKYAEPIKAAILKRDAAVLELNKLQGAYHSVNEDFRDLNRRIGERSRELARLIHMANPAREIGGTRLRSLNAA